MQNVVLSLFVFFVFRIENRCRVCKNDKLETHACLLKNSQPKLRKHKSTCFELNANEIFENKIKIVIPIFRHSGVLQTVVKCVLVLLMDDETPSLKARQYQLQITKQMK